MAAPLSFQARITSIDLAGTDSVTGAAMIRLGFALEPGPFWGSDPPQGQLLVRVPLATAQLVQINQLVTVSFA